MKKRILATTMALAMAFGTVMGGADILTVHAQAPAGYPDDVDDGCAREDREPGGGGGASLDIVDDSGSNDSGSSNDSDPGYDGGSGDSGSGYSDGGSGDSGSGYSGSGDSGSGDSGASYSAPAPRAAGITTGAAGREQFRALAKSGSGTYRVTHKGVEIATFRLMDSDKNAVPCTAVFLKQREDGKWAIEFQVTEKYAETTQAADTTGLTVGAPLDRTYMYNTLGVSYVTINDAVVIDIEAEAQAAVAKETAAK